MFRTVNKVKCLNEKKKIKIKKINQHPTLRGVGGGKGAIRVPVQHSRFSSVF